MEERRRGEERRKEEERRKWVEVKFPIGRGVL